MKVLVATKETQGQRSNDFCHCEEGEVLYFGSECDGESVDGSCGCRRSMSGTNTLCATTTMQVVEREDIADVQALADMLYQAAAKGGWTDGDNDQEWKDINLTEAKSLVDLVSDFPVGTVLERRGEYVKVRNCAATIAAFKAAEAELDAKNGGGPTNAAT